MSENYKCETEGCENLAITRVRWPDSDYFTTMLCDDCASAQEGKCDTEPLYRD